MSLKFRGRFFIAALFFIAAIFVCSLNVSAREWNYTINETDTQIMIDTANTNAEIDTINREVRLPFLTSPNAVDFAPDGSYSYAVLTQNGLRYFQFDGEHVIENSLLQVNTTNPLGFAFANSFPDVAVATTQGISTFRFTGTEMAEVPMLSIQGIANSVSITTMGDMYSVLDDNNVRTFAFSGNEMVEIEAFGVQGLTNPVAISGTSESSIAVIEKDKIRWFSFGGNGLYEVPALSVANGLADLKSIAVEDGRVTVIDGNAVKTYLFDGSEMSSITALSITSGLTNPSAIAIRPGSYDMLVVDGKNIDFYSFDGTGMARNSQLSVVVEDIIQGFGYASEAAITSKAFVRPADMVRVRANHALPPGTSVEWSVSNDNGATWVKTFRAINNGTPIAQYTQDNGTSWNAISGEVIDGIFYSSLDKVSPFFNLKDIWGEFGAASDHLLWKANLFSTVKEETPKIVFRDNKGIVIDANRKPSMPALDNITQNGWIYTTTPTFNWTFSDPDGDEQSAFRIVIRDNDENAIWSHYETENGNITALTLPTLEAYEQSEHQGGLLWSTGDYRFTIEVIVWDNFNGESVVSERLPFNVLAFERPRIQEIVSPNSSEIFINRNMPVLGLPIAKAGSKVTVLLDTVGPLPLENITGRFPYLELTGTVGEKSFIRSNGTNRTVSFEVWTEASNEIVPDGTVINMEITGIGTQGGTTNFWSTSGNGNGTFDYSEGIFRTEGTVYEDWFVVLQGSE